MKDSITLKIIREHSRDLSTDDKKLKYLEDKRDGLKMRIDNYNWGGAGEPYDDLCAEYHYTLVQIADLNGEYDE